MNMNSGDSFGLFVSGLALAALALAVGRRAWQAGDGLGRWCALALALTALVEWCGAAARELAAPQLTRLVWPSLTALALAALTELVARVYAGKIAARVCRGSAALGGLALLAAAFWGGRNWLFLGETIMFATMAWLIIGRLIWQTDRSSLSTAQLTVAGALALYALAFCFPSAGLRAGIALIALTAYWFGARGTAAAPRGGRLRQAMAPAGFVVLLILGGVTLDRTSAAADNATALAVAQGVADGEPAEGEPADLAESPHETDEESLEAVRIAFGPKGGASYRLAGGLIVGFIAALGALSRLPMCR